MLEAVPAVTFILWPVRDYSFSLRHGAHASFTLDRFVTGTHFNCRSLGLPPVESYVSIVITAFASPEYFYGQLLLILKTPENRSIRGKFQLNAG